MRILRPLLIILLFIYCLPVLHAQEKRYVIGHIYDEFKNPMAKVDIFYERGQYIYTTDSTGYFEIEGPKGVVLIFRNYKKTDRIVKIRKRKDNSIYFHGAEKLIALKRKEEKKIAKAERKRVREYNTMARSSESLSAITGHEKLSNPYTQKVIGQIVDEEGLSLAAACIMLNGKKIYTNADLDGFYGIDANVGDVLVFSFVGFDTVAVSVTDSIMNIRMKACYREL
jgi:CarboxypepD_reg-like domain